MDTAGGQRTPVPNPDLGALDKFVGTWEVSGGAEGKLAFEWMDGGFFLIQHVELRQNGVVIKGIEYIGHSRSFDGESSKEIRSRYYDTSGYTFDYVYEVDGDGLTIWAGEKGSPAYCRTTFSDDDNTVAAHWHYPDGGGYQLVGKRTG